MQSDERNEERDKIPDLSLEKAEGILRNVFQAPGIKPPENCSGIFRRNT